MLYFNEGVDECDSTLAIVLVTVVGELSGDLSTPYVVSPNCLSLCLLLTVVDDDGLVLRIGLVFGVECGCSDSNGITSSVRSTLHCVCLISGLRSSRLELVELDTLSICPFCGSNWVLPLK